MSSGGERIGSYEIVEEIGHGGLGTVFVAREPRLHREVALKRVRLDPPDVSLARRLVVEIRAVTGLSHPNIVGVIDCFEHDGMPYVAMERVRGGSLRVHARTLTPPQVVGVLEQILAALAHAEATAVLHGDLKPENVFVTREGSIKVADFAIARACRAVLGPAAGPIGTPAYMAPEQALGRTERATTDLYAVGVMAFELLARRPPFGAAASPTAVLARHVHEPVPSLGRHADAALDDWVRALLAKKTANRPQSAVDAWRALESIAVGAAGPQWRFSAALGGASGAPGTASRGRDRHRAGVALLACAVAALAAAVFALARDEDPPRRSSAARAVERAPVEVIARALRPVIAANRDVTTGLRSLSGSPPPMELLVLVARAGRATRQAARSDVAENAAPLFPAQKRYLSLLSDALRDPGPRQVAAATRAARRLRAAFVRLGDALAPDGAASVGGLTGLAAWSRAQRRRPATATVQPPPQPYARPPAAPPRPTATPTASPTPTATPTVDPLPTTEPPVAPTPSVPAPKPTATATP